MRGLAEKLVLAQLELTSDAIDPLGVGGRKRRDPCRTIAIGPAHVNRTLARTLHEIAQKVLVWGRQIHASVVIRFVFQRLLLFLVLGVLDFLKSGIGLFFCL